ncbi:F0F1 ATP synthase subunit B [Blochmannia endosymbiont of Colobopsis nipponica]|uniref:F0F1 ATP synthase subunit B n=1 Tax=Blochmannia endosymbiont of Colobopsis nipponica TaxID=2681987 RepID=UPI00177BAB53|nr:F0F1 ATP synthase subunit B [Blochmannia endosymbiont of Colobopsis nipponica]QOI10841.1 F0F1 ATP synthase subunit B [Blochmannia endosymbiont of Colobopsis nipponica]
MSLNLTIFGQAIAFVFFVVCCMKFIWPQLITIIEERQKKIADDIASAKVLKEKSNLMKIEADQYLQQAQVKAKSMIEQANRFKVRILNEARNQAQDERNKILLHAKRDIQVERRRAYEELRQQLASLIVNGAKQVIECSIDQDTNNSIIDAVISKL